MNSTGPVITGVGLVTPLGATLADTWRALLDGRRIATHTRIEVPAGSPVQQPRVTAIAVAAAAEAMAAANWPPGVPAGLITCTSKGPIETWMSGVSPPASDSVNGGAGVLCGDDAFGMASVANETAAAVSIGSGPRLTLSAACAGGLQALIRAAMLVANGEVDRVLVVAAEASVHPLFVGSFDRLGVLPAPGELCRPYDRDRTGFLMSEAAAAVCVEAAPPSLPGLRPIRIHRFATGADSTNLTGVDREGVTLRRLLARVAGGDRIDLIHGHGTGTQLNDAAELRAIADGLPDGGASATLYSHKAAIGHTLGASGLVATAVTVQAHRSGQVPPNVNTPRPMSTSARLSANTDHRRVNASLSVAAGFGGGISVVGLRTT